jgi:hypothetical protein
VRSYDAPLNVLDKEERSLFVLPLCQSVQDPSPRPWARISKDVSIPLLELDEWQWISDSVPMFNEHPTESPKHFRLIARHVTGKQWVLFHSKIDTTTFRPLYHFFILALLPFPSFLLRPHDPRSSGFSSVFFS